MPFSSYIEDEISKLRGFSKVITDFSELLALINKAIGLIGISPLKVFS